MEAFYERLHSFFLFMRHFSLFGLLSLFFLCGCDGWLSDINRRGTNGDSLDVDSIVVVTLDSTISISDSIVSDSIYPLDALLYYVSPSCLRVSEAILVHENELELIDRYHLAIDLGGYDYQVVPKSESSFFCTFDSTCNIYSSSEENLRTMTRKAFLDSLSATDSTGMYVRCLFEKQGNNLPTLRKVTRLPEIAR